MCRRHGGLDLKDHAQRLGDVNGQRYVAARLGLVQVVNEVDDCDDVDTLALAQFDEAGETHHLAVVGKDLGEGTHQDQAGELKQVDGRLGVPVALANPASAGMMCPGQCRLAGTEGRGQGQDGGTPWGEALLDGPCYPQKRIAFSSTSLLTLLA